MPTFGFVCDTTVVAERLREAGVVVDAGQKIRERRKRVAAANRSGERDGVVVVEDVDARAQRVRARLVRQVVDDLVHLVHAARWDCPTSVPNDATPEMLTAGPTASVGGAWRSLYANCARVSLTVRGDRLSVLLNAERPIDVVQAGRGAGRAQRAGAARVLRRDVVLAVSNGELVVAADLVIDLPQEIGAVDRVGIDARRDRRTRIADRREPRVDGADVGRRRS